MQILVEIRWIRGNQNSSDISWKNKMEENTDHSRMDKEQLPPERRAEEIQIQSF